MPRSLAEQVVVITGASSGIGRETALQFAAAGSAVVLAARNVEALGEVRREVERLGGRAEVQATDVSEWSQVQALNDGALQRFGRIDTWINNAAVSEYATLAQMTIEEIDRIVRVNLLGQVYGSKAAYETMRGQRGGSIINVASALAMRSVPLQSIYWATKHGIKGFTEALRLEATHECPEIRVCLVLPSSVNTPLFAHARSRLANKPMPIPPVYEPRAVAMVLRDLAVRPRRDVVVGGSGKLLTVLQRVSPGLLDWYMLRGGRMVRSQESDLPDDGEDNLFEPMGGSGSTTGDYGTRSKAGSVYTQQFELHPARKVVAVGAAVAGAGLLVRRLGR